MQICKESQHEEERVAYHLGKPSSSEVKSCEMLEQNQQLTWLEIRLGSILTHLRRVFDYLVIAARIII